MAGGAELKPQFFKVLQPGFLEKMLVPPAFNEILIEDNLSRVRILSPLKKSWLVHVEKEADYYYFVGRGWRGFVEGHGLDVGYAVTFKYESYGVFTFNAFDTSTCKIEFKLEPRDTKKAMPDRETLENLTCRHFRQKSQGSTTKWRDETATSVPVPNGCCTDARNDEASKKRKKTRSIRWNKTTRTGEPNYELRRVIKDYNFSAEAMDMPAGYCGLVGLTCQKTVLLRDPSGKEWRVNVYPRNAGKRLGNGWREFSKAQGLEEGDLCIFEPDHSAEELVFDVVIRRKK